MHPPSAAVLSDPNFLNYPAQLPPTGVTPNFTDPKDRGPVFVVAGGVLIALMMLFLSIRAYIKGILLRKVSWDDLTVVLSSLGAIFLYALCVWEIQKGPIGVHRYDLHVSDMVKLDFLIPLYIIEVSSVPILWVTKLTFFLLYLQLFWPMRWLRISVYVSATLTTAFYLGISIACFALATPRSGEIWITSSFSHHNSLQAGFAVPVSCVGLLIDVCLLVLPSIAVYKLQLHITQRIGLMLIFSTGSIAVAASALSIYYRNLNNHSEDVTWVLLDLQLVNVVEICVGVITACMPSLARAIRTLPPWGKFKSLLSSKREIAPACGDFQHEMNRLKRVETFIHTGHRDESARDEETGIHLKHDIQYSWSPT